MVYEAAAMEGLALHDHSNLVPVALGKICECGNENVCDAVNLYAPGCESGGGFDFDGSSDMWEICALTENEYGDDDHTDWVSGHEIDREHGSSPDYIRESLRSIRDHHQQT